MIKVTVPATSANVGAGFDALGLALSLHNTVTLEESDRIDIQSRDGSLIDVYKRQSRYCAALEAASGAESGLASQNRLNARLTAHSSANT